MALSTIFRRTRRKGERARRDDRAANVLLAALSPEDDPKPTFTARQADPNRETRPVPVLTTSVLPEPASEARTVLERTAQALRDLDWDAVNAAQQTEGLTYAAARGRVPLHDYLDRNFRPGVRPEHRHGEAAARRVDALSYPKCDVTAPVSATAAAYDAVMQRVNEITGTQGIGPGPRALPELTAGTAA